MYYSFKHNINQVKCPNKSLNYLKSNEEPELIKLIQRIVASLF